MSVNIESLYKVLDLEKKKGCLNSAVIGGLDRFLCNWSDKVIHSVTNPELLDRFYKLHLIKPDYASLTPQQRHNWIDNVLLFLANIEHMEAEDSDKNPKSKSRKPARTLPGKTTITNELGIIPDQSLDSSITVVKGINASLAKKLEKLGVLTIRDLLYFFPNRHLDYSQKILISQLTEGEEQTIVANVWQANEIFLGGRRSTEAIVGDESGNVRAVWFNNPYMSKTLSTNKRIVISGRVSSFNGWPVFESPEWEFAEDEDLTHTGRLVPLYPLTQGLRPRQVRRFMKPFISKYACLLEDFLPGVLIERCKLLALLQAISQAHYPDDTTQKDRARIRLAFNELFLLQLGVLDKKRNWQESQPGNSLQAETPLLANFLKSLPFELTSAQQRVLKEILTDLQQSQPMSRLLQGDVGSGKTVVATAALLVAVASGYQGAFMAPTEILAEQHFSGIRQLLSKIGHEEGEGYLYSYSGLLSHPLTVALLIGDIKQLRKQELQQRINNGNIDLVIGTHALIQKTIEFQQLGLVVIDEQHRFGVEQRSALRQKGYNPHVLVMTATPIPRTLALTLYGDLDLSVIDQLPPGRQAIKTKWLNPKQRNSAYAFIRRQVAEGHQAFIICPLIEESEAIQAKAAVAEYEHLSREVFPDLRLGLLHGRISSAEKDKVMHRFRTGEVDILVSTPVVEVGIDIPNATVMLVESADRFGLSQLHQFRGRVGRGQEQSYCILLAQNPSDIGKQRLDIIERTQDGFVLAEEDLNLRGPGEFFGTRQSGLPDLRMAKLSDVVLLELARKEAIRLFQVDPKLIQPEHTLLAKEMARVWQQSKAEWS
ncbi:ATP-dependent DNA helicase RecG [Chloroflexota bacterium]